MNNISITVKNGICLSCGLCEGICPQKCIQMKNTNVGMIPYVDNGCIFCGKCKKICPGLSSNQQGEFNDVLRGEVLATYVGRTKEREILLNAVSGGIATTLINRLLQLGEYDVAIGVRNRYFDSDCEMEIYNFEKISSEFQKSIYTMPSYRKIVQYIEENETKRIILIGSGCILNSLKKWVEENGLNLDRFLFLGLFCDCTLNSNIEKYFKDYGFPLGKKIIGIDYRSKKNGDFWPGNVKLKYKNREISLDRVERQRVVDFFKNERCLYCINHMNTQADISLGDNYTDLYSDKYGSNSIVIRTKKGEEYLNKISDNLMLHEVSYEDIINSQNVTKKIKNLYYSFFFCKKTGININGSVVYETDQSYEVKTSYKSLLRQINTGRYYKKCSIITIIYLLIKGKTDIKNRIKVWKKQIYE